MNEKFIPKYLRDKARVKDFILNSDGSYSISVVININGNEDFGLLYNYHTKSEEEKKYYSWVKKFKKQYAEKWTSGYDMTSKIVGNREIFGCTKNGEYFDLDFYSPVPTCSNFHKIIKALDLTSKIEFEIYNENLYGYDAMVTNQAQNMQCEKFRIKNSCKICASDKFKINMTFRNTGKKDLLEEQPCKEITEENWTNAFDWVTIDLECASCGKKIKRWYEAETM